MAALVSSNHCCDWPLPPSFCKRKDYTYIYAVFILLSFLSNKPKAEQQDGPLHISDRSISTKEDKKKINSTSSVEWSQRLHGALNCTMVDVQVHGLCHTKQCRFQSVQGARECTMTSLCCVRDILVSDIDRQQRTEAVQP